MRGRPFAPGNTMGRGRPRGSQNRRTLFIKALEGHGDAIIKQCMVLALKGDHTALRLCMERLLPPCRPSGHRFRLPAVRSVADLGPAFQAVLQEVAGGRMAAEEGEAISRVLENRRRLGEAEEFDSRLRALERNLPESLIPDQTENKS